MAYTDIVDLLLDEANTKADEIISSAKEDAKKITTDAKKLAKDIEKDGEVSAEKKKLDIEKKSSAVIHQYEKQSRLVMQQGEFKDVLQSLEKKLFSASDSDKKTLFQSFLSSISEKNGTISCNTADEKIISDAVKSAVKEFSVEVKDIKGGGFIFSNGIFEMDFSFPVVVRSVLATKYESEIFQKLFS